MWIKVGKWNRCSWIDDQQKEKPKVRVRRTTHRCLCVISPTLVLPSSPLIAYFPPFPPKQHLPGAGPDTVERLTLSQVWVGTLVIVSLLFSALGPQWGELSLRFLSGPGKTLLETLFLFPWLLSHPRPWWLVCQTLQRPSEVATGSGHGRLSAPRVLCFCGHGGQRWPSGNTMRDF